MKASGLVIAGLLVSMLAGCFDVETVVRVRPDGSGVVEERMLMGGELIAMAKQMQAMSGEQGQTNTLYKREELEERATAMGSGVSLVSVEPLVDEEREGYKAVFAFPDVNKLKLNQNPGDKAPSGAGMQSQGAQKQEEPITFTFKPGPTPELVVHSPGVKPGEGGGKPSSGSAGKGASAQDEAAAQMAMAMMKEMFKDLRISMAVEVEGRIIETNATFQEGSRVTLMEMDFGKLLANAEKFEEFAKSSPETLADAKAIMQDLEGIKAELNPEVSIRFAAGPQQHLASAAPGAAKKAKPTPARAPRQPAAKPKPAAPIRAASAPKPRPVAKPKSAPQPNVVRGIYGWRKIRPADASQHMQKLVRLTDNAGVAHKGMLTRLGDGNLTLALAQVDGGGTVQIPLAEVREFKVFERGM